MLPYTNAASRARQASVIPTKTPGATDDFFDDPLTEKGEVVADEGLVCDGEGSLALPEETAATDR